MKTKLQFLCAFLLASITLQAQETTVNLSLGSSYVDQVYYKLSTETETIFAANSWDVAFLRESNFNQSIRVNDAIGIEVFEASNVPGDWATIDVTNETSWTKLYNSDTSWDEGAFMSGSATYGWGEYNVQTHTVLGTVIFVLKYADGTYRKFLIESYLGAYNFKYSTWDGTAWSADQTATVSNTSNPNNRYNYYSLQNNTEVVAEPAITDWDFVFRKYNTLLPQGQYYNVTGVLHNPNVQVAENDEPSGMPANPTLTYSDDINTIGYDWKAFSGSGFNVDSNKAYYVKYTDGTIYRLYFTSFSGSFGGGNLSFNFENVTQALNLEEVSEITFGIYPNPSTGKKINLVYDVNKLSTSKNEVSIYATTGQKVYQTTLNSNEGFYNQTLDLSSLANGVYMLQFTSGEFSTTKRIILK